MRNLHYDRIHRPYLSSKIKILRSYKRNTEQQVTCAKRIKPNTFYTNLCIQKVLAKEYRYLYNYAHFISLQHQCNQAMIIIA